MEVMHCLKEEFDDKKEAVHHPKHQVEEVTEETLVSRRSRRSNDTANGTTTSVEGDQSFTLTSISAGVRCGYQILDVSSGSEEVDDNNGDKSKNSVYLDESAGMWKCRDCIWTYQNGNHWLDHIHQKHFNFGCRGALQEGTRVEKLSNKVEAVSAKLKDVDIREVLTAVISGKNVGILKDDTCLSSSTLKPSTKPREEVGKTSQGSIRNETEHESEDEEVLELEFERAVEKMHTHEYNMHCPNCSNPITKVILRRRKREKREKKDLLGCLSCFSIFIPKGNILDPFNIFGNRPGPEGSQIRQEPSPLIAPGSTAQQPRTPEGSSQLVKPGYSSGGSTSNGDLIIDIPNKLNGQIDTNDQYPGAGVQFPPEQRSVPREPQTENIPDTGRAPIAMEARSSDPWEFLKSIVYGGLMELITSLSIVSSAAASHATTLNVVVLGVANLIGGLLVLFHNLKDLKNEESNEANGNAKSRYQELLGRKENFILHSIFSVLSYIVFGLIPPVVYGFTFRETDNGDLKLVTVAAASLVCILILAAAKTFTRGHHTFMAYSKTTVYYVTGAAMASGIAYAAGHLLEMFLDDLGWFDAKSVKHLLIPENKTWASI